MFNQQFGLDFLQQGARQQTSTQEVQQPNQPMTSTAISGNYQQEPFAYQQQNYMPKTSKTVEPISEDKKSLDMQRELAMVQALSSTNSQQGGSPGIGRMVGQAGGGAVGAAIGAKYGGPQGAQMGQAIGGGAGGSIGTLIDWHNDKKAAERAQTKETTMKRKVLKKMKRKSAAEAIRERRTTMRGVALDREQEAMRSEDILKMQRENALTNMIDEMKRKAEYEKYAKESYLQNRRIV